MSPAQKEKALDMIQGTLSYADLKDCDLVVEAVFESMDIKKRIFKALDEVCKNDAFLCSNTSALDLDVIASVCRPFRRPNIMGTHFFSPANVMKLLENVRGASTSDETVATMMKWGTRINKWTILVGNCHGFVGNRMVFLYSRAAQRMLTLGALPSEVDRAALEFGMRMGPFAMDDLTGLDLGIQAKKKSGLFHPDSNPRDALVEMGRTGQRAQAGWFDYPEGRQPRPSNITKNLLRKMYPVQEGQHVPNAEEIIEALFMPMINEGFKILEEGMAQRPADIDVCYIHGYSFPRTKGGPMFYADTIGLPSVRDALESMDIPPAKLLLTCIASGMSLAKYWSKHGKEVRNNAKKLYEGGQPHYSRVPPARTKL